MEKENESGGRGKQDSVQEKIGAVLYMPGMSEKQLVVVLGHICYTNGKQRKQRCEDEKSIAEAEWGSSCS